jgi:hypothetical protein
MDLADLVAHISDFSDLELAVLLSLIAQQHCLIYTDDGLVDSLASELALIVSDIFKLSYVVLEANDLQSAEHFGNAILDEHHNFASDSDFDNDSDGVTEVHSRIQNINFGRKSQSVVEKTLDNRLVVNVVIAKDFNKACHEVQIQALELIRRKRIFSHTTVHVTPKVFLFIPILSTATKHIKLNHHLVWSSHVARANLICCRTIAYSCPTLTTHSTHSQIWKKSVTSARVGHPGPDLQKLAAWSIPRCVNCRPPSISNLTNHIPQTISTLQQLGKDATMTPEIRRYLQDIIVFMRLERGVDGGVTPYANVCFVKLAKYILLSP